MLTTQYHGIVATIGIMNLSTLVHGNIRQQTSSLGSVYILRSRPGLPYLGGHLAMHPSCLPPRHGGRTTCQEGYTCGYGEGLYIEHRSCSYTMFTKNRREICGASKFVKWP